MKLNNLLTGTAAVGIIIVFLGLLAVRPLVGALFATGVIFGIAADTLKR